MDLNRRYKIDKDKMMYKIIDGEMVILNLKTGICYILNEVGTTIWEAIKRGRCLGEILNSLKGNYSISERRLKNDILELTMVLKKNGLIRKS